MANLSSANGSFTIHTNNLVTMETLIHLMQRSLEDCEYGTYFTDQLSGEDQFEIECVNENQYDFYTMFGGTGRWAYCNNVESMTRWMKSDATEDELKLLENEDFTYVFDFTDYEPGCEVFYHAVMEVNHVKGQPLEVVQVTEHECEGFDITLTNIAEQFDYTFCEAMDELYWDADGCDEERKEEILSDLEGQRESIEGYFKMPLETLIQCYPSLV